MGDRAREREGERERQTDREREERESVLLLKGENREGRQPGDAGEALVTSTCLSLSLSLSLMKGCRWMTYRPRVHTMIMHINTKKEQKLMTVNVLELGT